MSKDFDRERIVDCMFDPVTSMILAELEDGKKECSSLAELSDISETGILERLSYLLEHGFVTRTDDGGRIFLAANHDKLNEVVESGDNFGATIEGLEKMDSYLN